MTETEVKEMCSKMGVYFDPDHPDHITASKLQALAPPFMEYLLEDHPVYADGKRYVDIKNLTIRIYSDTEVDAVEPQVTEVLDLEDLRWKRTSGFLDDLFLWAIEYKLQV